MAPLVASRHLSALSGDLVSFQWCNRVLQEAPDTFKSGEWRLAGSRCPCCPVLEVVAPFRAAAAGLKADATAADWDTTTCPPVVGQKGSGASIAASALSRDTYPVRAGSGVKGVPRQRGVIWTLDAADGSPEWNSGTKSSAVDWTSSLGRIFRAEVSTKARLLESCGGLRFVHQSSMRSSRP
jgi:hypothetical protein